MKSAFGRVLARFLARDPAEIATRAASFRIGSEDGRRLVEGLGSAFIAGYNAMLRRESFEDVAAEGMLVPPHFRPFFFEGAAMGYFPRGYLSLEFSARRVESDLMRMHPAFLYLYYVGLGFWYAFRHRGRPASLESIAPSLDPMYFPLCYDGFGFKVGFFDYPRDPGARRRLERCPPEHRHAIHQGFGRALFFVYMDDEAGFGRVRDATAPDFQADLEFGRSLALGFTRVDRPLVLVEHIAAGGAAYVGPRLTGVTWALTARSMHDPEYFDACLGGAPEPARSLLRRLPEVCRDALAASRSYREWQEKCEEKATRIYLSETVAPDSEAREA